MAERLLFLTGHLAEPRLRRLLDNMGETAFAWQVVDIGVKVAALMTEPIILRRLPRPVAADRVVLPGRAGVDPARLSEAFGVAFERGPDEIADIPRYLGLGGRLPDLSRHDVRIFAEIVEAAELPPAALLQRARALHAEGADVIDLGCKPGTPFPGLEDAVRMLRADGMRVSVDSGDLAELRRGAVAGADYLLSLTEDSLDVAEDTAAIPVLVPKVHGDLDSLARAADAARARDMACLLDPVLDPIHFGFAAALARYVALRARLPDAEILMGTGKPDGTDRRGFLRRHGAAAGHLLGTADPQRTGGAGQPAHPAHRRRARFGAAHDVRGVRQFRPAARLRRRPAAGA